MALSLLVSAVVLAAGPASARDGEGPRVHRELPATAGFQEAHNSPLLVEDPTEGRFVVLASRLDGPDFGCALQISGDGGQTFALADPVPRSKLPAGAEKCYAPEVAFDRDGLLYYLFVGLRGQNNTPMGAFLTTSADRGRSFSPPRQILGPHNFQVQMAIDRTAGRKGRLHLVWLAANAEPILGALPPPPNPILAAHSDDGGMTFSEPVQVSDPGRDRVVAPALALGRDHALHVLYYDLQRDAVDYQGLEGPPWQGNWTLVLSTSQDGGRHFGRGVVVEDQIVPPSRVMLIFTMPPAALAVGDSGRVFAAWTDARHGDPDVLMRRSTDGGRTWGQPARLNDDVIGNGRHQDLPRLSIAPNGRLDVIFYDRRNDPENARNDVFYTFSDDAAKRFSPNVKLTDTPSDARFGQPYVLLPAAKGLIEFGSRIALVSLDHKVLAAWTDTRNSVHPLEQNIFSTSIELPEAGFALPWPVVALVVGLTLASTAFVGVRRRGRSRRDARSVESG